MKLRTKFFLLMGAVFLVFTAVVGFYSQHLKTHINELWGARFVEKQVLFDKHRTLQPLMHEITLARRMATEPALLEMALHEEDAGIKQRGLEVLEHYRNKFQDRTYFAALVKSGNYYYNDADNTFGNRPLRYTLSPQNHDDQWFYSIIASDTNYQVNVNPDAHLGETKVWIDVAIKSNGKVVGLIGTGLDITQFLKESVGVEQPGIHNLFVDRDLAVQLYRDRNLIDYASITKTPVQRRKVDALLTDPADIEQLRQVMQKVEKSPEQVGTLWVTFAGEKHMLGVAFLPEIGWYDLTLMDDRTLTLLHDFYLSPALLLMFMAALFAVGYMLHRLVLDPISKMGRLVDEIRHGHYEVDMPQIGNDEIAQLSAQFRAMVEVVRNTNRELEDKVALRTQELSLELAERKRAEDELRHSETLLRTLYDTTSDAVMLLTEKGFFNCNKATLKIFGCADKEAFFSKHPADLSPPRQPCGTDSKTLANQHIATAMKNGSFSFEWIHMRADNGMTFPAEVLLNAMELDGKMVLQAVVRDITERKEAEAQIRTLAFYDTLTQLPNRRLLNDRLTQAIAAGKRHGRYAALMVLDLDNFKPLNDTHGHVAGDQLLVEVARRLKTCVREVDTVARFGGDEFVVMLVDLEQDQEKSTVMTSIVAEKIRATLAESYLLSIKHEGSAETIVEYRCSASIGVVVFIDHAGSQNDLFRYADAAMYQAKESGRNLVRFHAWDA